MKASIGFTTRVLVGAVLITTLGLSIPLRAQASLPAGDEPPAARGPQSGKIKGDNVYIRSGSHINYYPVTKLNRGDPVTVVGEQYGWFEILPPAGTFSLIDKTYVDRTGDTGTLNGDCVVYAGSNLDKAHYAKQARLKKGDTVKILGETPDGAFYKIEPPAGATLWVKADFVEGVTPTGAAPTIKPPERVAPGELGIDTEPRAASTRPAGGRSGPTTRPIVRRSPTPAERTSQARAPRPAASEKYEPQMSAIEAEIEAENTKPFTERSYDRLLSKLRPLAEQTEDEIAALYAQTRIRQIEGYTESQAAARQIAGLRDEAMRIAAQIAKDRPGRKPFDINPADMIVVRGEIRPSNVFKGDPGRPKRWRVVDPAGGAGARTLAYIEVPPELGINPADYFGKHVGIRASAREVAKDTIPPIPLYTVSEIVILDASTRPARVSGSTAVAGPGGLSVPPPSRQPTTNPSNR